MRSGGLAVVVVLGMAAAFVGWTKPATSQTKPTIVLVHGAFAESSSWNAVIAELSRDGYAVVPKRLTPGWEKVVSPRAIGVAYAAMAVALAISPRSGRRGRS